MQGLHLRRRGRLPFHLAFADCACVALLFLTFMFALDEHERQFNQIVYGTCIFDKRLVSLPTDLGLCDTRSTGLTYEKI